MNLIYKIALILVIGIASCKEKQKDNSPSSNQPEIDNIKLTSLSNSPINWDQYQGKTVFLNFWATWCKPCLQEMPSIEAAIKKLENENIVFLFASDEASDQIENFKRAHPFNFNYVRIENMNEVNIIGLPTTIIFNSAGKLSFSEMGYRKWDDKQNIDLILNIVKAK